MILLGGHCMVLKAELAYRSVDSIVPAQLIPNAISKPKPHITMVLQDSHSRSKSQS